MISLNYSQPKNKPFINLGEYGMLIFSDMTKTKKGYKYMAYARRYIKSVPVKTKSGRQFKEVEQNESYVFNMHLKRNAAGNKGVPKGTIPRPLVKKLLSIIEPLLIENTYLPFDEIKLLGEKLSVLEG